MDKIKVEFTEDEFAIFKTFLKAKQIALDSSNTEYSTKIPIVNITLDMAIEFYDYITDMLLDDPESYFIDNSDGEYASPKWNLYEDLITKIAKIKGVTC